MDFDDSSEIIELPPPLVPKRDADRPPAVGRANIPVDASERQMATIPPKLPAALLPSPPPGKQLPPPLPEPPPLKPTVKNEEPKTASDGPAGKLPVGSVPSKAEMQPSAEKPRGGSMTGFWVICAFFAIVIVAGIVAERGSRAPVVSQTADTPAPSPPPLTPSRIDYPLDATPPSPSLPSRTEDHPPAETPAPVVVYATPYPRPTYTYVPPTAPPASAPPATPKIARTCVWRNAKYAIPQDHLSYFNAIRNAGLARMKSVEKINKQLDGLPAQIAKASGREKTRLLQLESDLRMAGNAELQSYEEITTRMDDFMGRLETEHPECLLSGRGLSQP